MVISSDNNPCYTQVDMRHLTDMVDSNSVAMSGFVAVTYWRGFKTQYP